jgi:hypothetical protein
MDSRKVRTAIGEKGTHKYPVPVSRNRAAHAPVQRAEDSISQMNARPQPRRIFLLSPANASGIRAGMLLGDNGRSALAMQLRNEGVPLGEIFTFISGLYFRGKLAYARRFAHAPEGLPGAFVITACGGLILPETALTLEQLREISKGPIEASDIRYRAPLDRDLKTLFEFAGKSCEIVLLGSVATPKYAEPLLAVFGKRLLFPAEFAGRGDMSRGGLMLRCVREGTQLTYVPVATSPRHGPKPPKLPKLSRIYARQPGA